MTGYLRGVSDNQKASEEDMFVTRTMSPTESEEVYYNLINPEKWEVSIVKFKALVERCFSNFFVTIKKETNEVIAVAVAMPTLPGQYIFGDMVVRHDHRKQGHMARMVKMVIEKYAKDTITLTAVAGLEQCYRKAGFQVVEPAHHVYYFKVNRMKVDKACSYYTTDEDIAIQPFTNQLFAALREYDANARGYNYEDYLFVLTSTSSHFLVATSTSSGQVVGYAAVVDQRNRLWLDGMYADSDSIAFRMFRTMLDAYPQIDEIKIQTSKPRDFLVQFGNILPKSRTYTRMTRGPTAILSLTKLYSFADH